MTIKAVVEIADFEKIDIRVGTVTSARVNEKARKPAYALEIDFGPDVGRKTSSAQITGNYTPERLIGAQVVAVLNFRPRNVAGVNSEVLVLGAVSDDKPTILLAPDLYAANGARIS